MSDSIRLTRREGEVLGLLARGNSARKIGEILGITTRTVHAHSQSTKRKLDTANSTHAVAVAIRDGLIEP